MRVSEGQTGRALQSSRLMFCARRCLSGVGQCSLATAGAASEGWVYELAALSARAGPPQSVSSGNLVPLAPSGWPPKACLQSEWTIPPTPSHGPPPAPSMSPLPHLQLPPSQKELGSKQ